MSIDEAMATIRAAASSADRANIWRLAYQGSEDERVRLAALLIEVLRSGGVSKRLRRNIADALRGYVGEDGEHAVIAS